MSLENSVMRKGINTMKKVRASKESNEGWYLRGEGRGRGEKGL